MKKQKLKLIETISNDERILILENKADTVGVMPTMILSTDSFYNLSPEIGCDLYMNHGKRRVGVYYNSLLEVADLSQVEQPLYAVNRLIGQHIRSKYYDKWSRIYSALITNYSVLDNIEHSETTTYTDEEHRGYIDTKNNTLESTDTTTYDVTTDENTATSTDETVITERLVGDSVYGYNSEISVPDNESVLNESVNTSGNAENNTTVNKNVKTGTESVGGTETETGKTTGTEDVDFKHTEEKKYTGRDKEGSTLVDSEVMLRNKYIFTNMVINDILAEIALCIY